MYTTVQAIASIERVSETVFSLIIEARQRQAKELDIAALSISPLGDGTALIVLVLQARTRYELVEKGREDGADDQHA